MQVEKDRSFGDARIYNIVSSIAQRCAFHPMCCCVFDIYIGDFSRKYNWLTGANVKHNYM